MGTPKSSPVVLRQSGGTYFSGDSTARKADLAERIVSEVAKSRWSQEEEKVALMGLKVLVKHWEKLG